MTFLFKKPKAPKPTPLPPVVKREDREVARASEEARLAFGRRKGRKATILTSPLGTTDNTEISRKALLGEV